MLLRARANAAAAASRSSSNPIHNHPSLRPARAAPYHPNGPPPPTAPYATVVPRASSGNNSSNPLSGMLSGLFGGGGAGAAAAATAAATTTTPANPTSSSTVVFTNTAPSWDELRQLVEQRERDLGGPLALSDRGGSFLSPDLSDGPPHPLSLRRTFGTGPQGPVDVILYRDHAAWCPYCEKVVLQLEEKRVPYEIRKINMRCYGPKPADFLAKVPSGLLPVLEIDGRIITESATIMALLEDRYSHSPEKHRPLMPPAGTPERSEAEALLRLERRFFGDWLDWLCGGGSWGGGVDLRQQAASQRRFELTVAAIEAAMPEPGPFFMGLERPSLVDITFAPMLERAAASLAYYKGWYLRGQGNFPKLEKWFDAMETRFEAFAAFRSDYFTHAHDLPPQLGGCTMTPDGQAVAAMLDGGSGGADGPSSSSSWRLPLPPLSSTSMPEPFAGKSDDALDRVEAAARLVANHGAVVRFALRGAGEPGSRPVSAPLADPSAVPAMQYERAADAALRHVAHALLVGVEGQGEAAALRAMVGGEGGGGGGAGAGAAVVGDVPAVVASLEYLRDRVGVPRDMRFPAARQLRAHLNWFIDTVCGV